MPVLKDAPMACTASNDAPFLSTLETNRAECIRLLKKHEHETPDRLWQSSDPQARAPKTAKAKARMKLVLNITIRNNKPVFPPRNTRLSDEWLYLATKFLKATDRAKDYPYDFDEKGDVDPARVPSGPPPIIWAHGLPFFPVYKGYYILCGREHARWLGWLLSRKQFQTVKQFPMWTVGLVVAPGSAVDLPRTVERQLRAHKALSVADVEGNWEKNPAARDVVSTKHWDSSVVPVLGGGYRLMPIYRVPGYNLRCGPDWENGRSASFVGREAFVESSVEDFDWDAFWEWEYRNEKFPDYYSPHSDESESEEENEEDEVDEQDENQVDDRDEAMPAGPQDQDNHQDGQESEAHAEHAKAHDDEDLVSDPEEHEMMLNFIRKCRQESHERGMSHAVNKVQDQAQSTSQKTCNMAQTASTKVQQASTKSQSTSTKTQKPTTKNITSSEPHRAMGTQTARAAFKGPNDSTTENSSTNPDRASSLAAGNAIQETRDQAESTQKTSTKTQEQQTSRRAQEASNKNNTRSEVHQGTGAQASQAASMGPDNLTIENDATNPAQVSLAAQVSEISERTICSLKRAMAEYRASQGTSDMLLPSAKKRKTVTAETDEMRSIIQEDRGKISAKIDTDDMSATIVDRSGLKGNKAPGPVSILKRKRTEDKAPEGAGAVPLRRSKRLEKVAAVDTDEAMSVAQENVQEIVGSVSTEVQAEGTSTDTTDTVDRSGQDGNNTLKIVSNVKKTGRADWEAAIEDLNSLFPPIKKWKKTVRFDIEEEDDETQ